MSRLVSRPLSLKKHFTTAVRPDVSPGRESNKQLQPDGNAADVQRTPHRSSYVSVQSDAQTFFVGQARTARRHSLTPRIINIVSSSNAGNDTINSTAYHRPEHDQNRRLSIRARSASPAKPVVYSGSPANLNAGFGIDTCDREPGQASSGMQGPATGECSWSDNGTMSRQEKRKGWNHLLSADQLPAAGKDDVRDEKNSSFEAGSGLHQFQ